MTTKRKEKIKQEAERRVNEWLKNSTFDEMTVGGSPMRFDMALGLCGYPFLKKPKWMKGKKFNKFITDLEYNSKEYDDIILVLFYEYKRF